MDAHKDKAIRKKYSVALMPNHKWEKLFSVMAESGSDISGIEYHFTDTEKVFYGHAPTEQQVWDTAIDDPVKGLGGPVKYKLIEYIVIPYVYSYRAYEDAPLTERTLNIDAFLNALKKVGSFPISKTDEGIVIYGYKT